VSEWAVALIGVGGTLAGAAVGGALAYASDRARWTREQSSRWADERRAAYAKVIVECEYVVYDALSNLLDKENLTYGDVAGELRPVQDRLRPLIADLELIGTTDDAKAARELSIAAQKLLNTAIRDPDAPAMPGWNAWETELTKFKEQARKGLHLTGQ
jgi:hypothetical protein